MSKRVESDKPLERYAWMAVVATVAAMPLAVTKLPFLDTPLTFSAFGFPQTFALAMGTAVSLGLWAAAVWREGSQTAVSRTLLPFAALIAWSVVSAAAGLEPLRSFLGTSLSSLAVVNLLSVSAAAFLALQLARSRDRLTTLTWAVIGSGSVVALIALAQQVLGADVFGVPGIAPWLIGRGISTMGNPDHLGTFLVLPTMLSAFLVLTERDHGLTAAAASFAVLLTALVGTLTRGAWVAVLAGTVVGAALLWKADRSWAPRKRLLIVAALAGGAILVAFLASDFADLRSRFDPAETPLARNLSEEGTGAAGASPADTVNLFLSDRLNLWRSSLLMAADRPLTGSGTGAYTLGWYPNAVEYSSGGGRGVAAEDAHSLPLTILGTTGIPGLLAWLAAVGTALVVGVRNALRLTRSPASSGKAPHYVAWLVAAAALQVALLVAALNTAVVAYAFLSLTVLLIPTLRPVAKLDEPVGRLATATGAIMITVVVLVPAVLNARAETALAPVAFAGAPAVNAVAAVGSVPWNIDTQIGYYDARLKPLTAQLKAGATDARAEAEGLAAELATAEEAHPHEFFYPWARAQLLTDAATSLGDDALAEAAVGAADEALAIMPASIQVRVQKALALAQLQRYPEMADALAGYWENELGSAYPGILYAQAKTLSGDPAEAGRTFDSLLRRFPAERQDIEAARAQVQGQ